MIIKNQKSIFDILKKNNINITGAFHIGANKCEELVFYKQIGLKPEDVIWIDAIEESVINATNRGIPNVYNAIISDEDDVDVVFNIANNFESSSLLEMKTHLIEHPTIHFIKQIKGKSITVNSFFEKNNFKNVEKYNFWNFDIQGAELMALKGATNYIKYVKVINVEVNVKELYKDCALMGEIDNFLSKYGFKRVITNIGRNGWGDAVYIIPKNNTILRELTKKYSKTKKIIFNKSRSNRLSRYTKVTKHSKQSKILKKNIKYIYIKNDAGFGNKIFDIIFAVYLYNLYQGMCNINYVLTKSSHETIHDLSIDKIFPKAKNKLNFMTLREYENININPKIKIYKIYDKDDIMQAIETFPSYDSLNLHTKIDANYRLTYKIYDTFGLEDKSIFNINEKIIKFNYKNPKHTQLLTDIKKKNDYSIVHIRYGDKLHFLKKYINSEHGDDKDIDTLLHSNVDQFLLYTPQYYIDKINDLLIHNKNHTIYIISDSDDIVKEFIMKPTRKFNNNPRVIYLENLNWLSSFYIMIYASHIIMSSSTFSYAAAYFNKRKASCDLLLYHYDTTKDTITPDEYAIAPHWNILSDRKYILNYSYKIGFPILKFKYHWRY